MIRSFCSSIAALVLFAGSLFGQAPVGLAPFSTFLKANSSVQQVATDSQGFIYVYGTTFLNGASLDSADFNGEVFVARLDPTATTLMYMVGLGGSSPTFAGAMAVDAAGNAYITGYTDASDFPTVPYAPGPTTENAQVPFAAKLNVNGTIVYSTLFSNGVRAIPQSIAVDSSGEAILSGFLSGPDFPTTAGAYNNAWNSNPPFITKLDSTGTKRIFSSVGVGGSGLAVDSAGDIVIAGTTSEQPSPPNPLYPTTPGAFQTTYTPLPFCIGVCTIGDATIGEQYVTKLSADGSTLLYSTFVSGSLGAYNAGMAIDASGDVWLTGDTPSTDYPYTLGQAGSQTFTTELDLTLSKVLLSVPQGVPPGIGSNLTIDAQGNLIEAAAFPTPAEETVPANILPAPAPPSTGNTPLQCLPGGAGAFVIKISSQDGGVLGAQILSVGTLRGSVVSSTVDSQGNIYVAGLIGLPDVPLTPGVFYDPAVMQRTVGGAFLERTSFSVPSSAVGCVTDATTMKLPGPAAPGQLLSIYGNGIGPIQPVVGLVGDEASVPTALGGVKITFDGQPAPILYASSTQINVQVPFEVKRNASTVMQVNYNGSVLETRLFAVAAQNPSLFVNSTTPNLICGGEQINGSFLIAMALNEDGSVNSCANPAPAGSQFTLFINGIGTAAANQNTGDFTASSPGPDFGSTAAVSGGPYSIEVHAFTDEPDSISGIGQVKARVPETITSPQPMSVTLTLNGLEAGPLGAGSEGAIQIPVIVFVSPSVSGETPGGGAATNVFRPRSAKD